MKKRWLWVLFLLLGGCWVLACGCTTGGSVSYRYTDGNYWGPSPHRHYTDYRYRYDDRSRPRPDRRRSHRHAIGRPHRPPAGGGHHRPRPGRRAAPRRR